MALTNASRLADFGTGIGTQGAILQVDNADQMVGIGTTDPTAQLEVKQDFKVGGASTITGALTVSGDLTASGNVTIGGTLTYEDVTNIDSVGLITARSGINVSGGEFKVGTALTVGSAGVTTISARVYIRSSFPRLDLEDTDSDSDFAIINSNGDFMVWDQTNSANRFSINSSGVVAANSDLEVAGSQYITDSIIHTGDTDTKIRFPSADTISFETGGSARAFINSAGDLTVGGTAGTLGKVYIRQASDTDTEGLAILNGGGTNSLKLFLGDTAGTVGHLGHGGQKQLNITQAGLVGIGITNPGAELHAYHATSNTIAQFESGDAGAGTIWKDNSTYSSIEQNGTDFIISADQGASHANSALLFKVDGSERSRIDSNGRLIIGHTASTGEARYLQVVGTTGDTSSIQLIRHSANASCSQVDLSKSRNGTIGSNTIVQDDDVLGQITFRGDDGTDLNSTGATISASVDGTPGANDMPGRLVFSTTADGSNSATERLRITNDGKIGMGLVSSSGSICDPDGNELLIRSASTVGTNKGHIMLTGDSATVGQGPQIVFSESGGGSSFAGGYIGFLRTGSNSIGDLVFGTRNTSGDADTAPTERLRITAAGLVGLGTDNPTAYLSFLAKRSTQTMPPICFQSSYGTALADAAISTTDDTGGTDIMMGSNVYMGQNGAFVRYKDSYGSAAVRCQYTGNTLFYNKSGNNAPVESLRITGSGYREIRNYHYGAYAFTDNTAKTTITIGDPGDSKCSTVRFLLTLEDVSYRQGFWQGEYTVFVSNATGGPGVNYYLKEHWQQIGSTNWSGGSVTVSCTSGGAVQVTATNGHNDAAGDIYVHILQVVGDFDGSTVASISA